MMIDMSDDDTEARSDLARRLREAMQELNEATTSERTERLSVLMDLLDEAALLLGD